MFDRKGQFSVYLKPIIIVIMAVLLVALLTSTLKFGGQTQKERAEYEFDSQAPKIKNKILKCLSVSENYSSSGILINYSKLREWNKEHKYSEPTCAEDFDYGWNATITMRYLETQKANNSHLPIAYIPGEHDGVASYIEAHGYTSDEIDWSNITEGDVQDYGAIILGSPVDLEDASNKNRLKEKLKQYVYNGGSLITTGEAWENIDKIWPGKMEHDKDLEGVLCLSATNEGVRILNMSQERYSIWLRSQSPLLKESSQDVRALASFMPDCPSVTGTEKCTSEPESISTSPALLGFDYGSGFVMNSVFSLEGQFGCGINSTDFLDHIVGREDDMDIVTGGDSSCSVKPRREYGGSVDLAFIVDRSNSMQSPNMCMNIQNIVDGLTSVGIDADYKVYGLPEGPDVRNMDLYSQAMTEKHFTTKGIVNYPCVEEMTDWPDNIAFHPLKDAKSEGWGPGASYVLENHEWRPQAEKLIVVLGDQDLTGGCNGRMWRSDMCEDTECDPYQASTSSSGQDLEGASNTIYLPGEGSEGVAESERNEENMSLCTNCERDWHCGQVPFYFANPWRKEPGTKCKGSSGGELDSEVEVMEEVMDESFESGVSMFFLHRKEYILTDEYINGDDTILDYLEAMERVAEGTGGKVFKFRRWDKLVDYLKDKLRVMKVDKEIEPCPNVNFMFGEAGFGNETRPSSGYSGGGSMGVSLDGKAIYTYPAQIMQTPNLRTPARIKLEVRKGDLETLSGAINRVYTLGKERKGDIERNIEIDLDSEVYIDNVTFQRLKEVEYTLSGGSNPSDYIKVDEDLRAGVNGVQLFEDDDELSTSHPNAEYKGKPIRFNASVGEAIQVIARNLNPPRMKISPLVIHCCGGKKQRIASGLIVNNHTNPEEYEDRGVVFFHNFTTIDIGSMENYHERGICINSGGRESCVDLKPDEINKIRLNPGRHIIKVRYKYSEDVVEVIK